jgi:N-acetylglutamate synthase-like GNAT family acetyltransferase
MPLHVPAITLNPPITPELRNGLLDLWFDVSQAGGSVGYTPSSPRPVVQQGLTRHLEEVQSGSMHLLVAEREGQVVASCAFAENPLAIQAHFMELRRFMVHPSHQRSGIGRWLANRACDLARDELQIESVHIQVRSGESLEAFWTRCGFSVVAVIPQLVKLSHDEYRDGVYMQRSLR